MRPTVLYLVVTVLVPNSLVRAQSPGSLPPGTRIRITAPSALTPARQTGSVLALRSDTLLLQPDGGAESLALPLAAVTELEVGHRGHRSTGTGFLLGVLVGGATGAGVGAAAYQNPKPCPSSQSYCGFGNLTSRGVDATVLGVLGGLVGGIVGAFVGHAHQSESWQQVPLALRAAQDGAASRHLGITTNPAGRGVALSIGLPFGGARPAL